MNNVFEINLIIIFGICLIFWFIFLFLTRNIKTTVGGGAGDNDYLLRATAKSNEWRWPSDMHIKTYTGTSTSQRDTTVLLLVLFQKIFRDKLSEFPIVALWSFTHTTSVFLIYLIGSYYWGPAIALYISFLYSASFWMWQMSLFVGHLNVATMFFLFAVYCTTFTISAEPHIVYLWLFASGFSFCCMLFASSSAGRYITLFFVAVFFARHQAISNQINIGSFYQTIIQNNTLGISLIFTIIFLIFLIFLIIFYKKIIMAIYHRTAPWPLNGLLRTKKYPLEHYIEKAQGMLESGLRLILKPYIFLFIVVNSIGINYFIPIFIGFALVFFILTLPDIKRNFTFYFNYLYISYVKPGINSGLVRYVKYGYFVKNNLKIPSNLRGGGFWWVPKIFFRMAPFHTAIYGTILISIIFNIFSPSSTIDVGSLIFLIIASLSPILWAELTKAYQVSRSYSSGLIGFLLLIGFGIYFFQGRQYFWTLALILLAVTFMWNLWKFFTDIYPARMSFNKIIKSFDKYKIKEIYTYKTFYNESFLDNFATTPALKNLKITFIQYLKDVQDGWILVPATTHKAGYLPAEESIQQGDFREDLILNELLETKKIEQIATIKFKTVYGSDNIWLQEADIMTYLDLMLHYITDKDRFRGHAWLLHSSKLQGWTN